MDPLSAVNAVIGTVGKVVDFFRQNPTLAEAGRTVDRAGAMADFLKNNVGAHLSDTSMISLTGITRAEPLTIVSEDCLNYEFTPKLLDTMASLYSSYFLQAIEIMTSGIRHVEVLKTLDALNPNRNMAGFLLQSRANNLAADSLQNLDSHKYRLPSFENAQLPAKVSDNVKMIYEIDNLAVGKQLSVGVDVGEDCIDKNGKVVKRSRIVSFTVNVRLVPVPAHPDTLFYIFTNKKNDSIGERLESVRTGRISLIKDGIFCRDLIREYRKAAMKDKQGLLAMMTERVNKNRLYGLLNRNPSLAMSSNLYILSSNDVREMEMKTGFRMSDVREREKLLSGTQAMIIAVVDADAEMVDFYFDTIAKPSTMSLRQLKKSGSKGADIEDVFRSLFKGQSPSF